MEFIAFEGEVCTFRDGEAFFPADDVGVGFTEYSATGSNAHAFGAHFQRKGDGGQGGLQAIRGGADAFVELFATGFTAVVLDLATVLVGAMSVFDNSDALAVEGGFVEVVMALKGSLCLWSTPHLFWVQCLTL